MAGREYRIVEPFFLNGVELKEGDSVSEAVLGPFVVDLAKAGCIAAPKGVVLAPEPPEPAEGE